MNKLYKIIFVMAILFSTSLFAQHTVSGVVTDATSGDRLIGANVYFPDLNVGAATDANGEYSISVAAGTHLINCSFIGFDKIVQEIVVNADMTLNFSMQEYQFTLSVTVISDRVKERETPVAFSNIDKKDIEFMLGSQDIPLAMNITPSVFATNQGSGAGDSRINVRGFDQRNVAVMINGNPMNDMENGWVYWSNWDGLGDATSSIQMQRGLSAVNLAVPSIGGTMNIITDPSQHKAGAFFKNEIGSAGFHKQSLFAHTGLVGGKFAMSFGGVRKVGDGMADRTYTDAWAYYLGMAYQINNNNRLELYAMGAPQAHGHRLYKLNAATFSHELAEELGFPSEALLDPKLREQGILYNANYNSVSPMYNGMQWERSYWNNNLNLRHDPTFLMERRNFFHKPLVNLNWYSKFSDKFSLYSTVYYSGGQGGGTGTFGSINYDYSLLQRVPDWNSTIAENMENIVFDDPYGTGDSSYYAISTDRRDDETFNRSGILRNSVNQQWTFGALSKAYWKVSKSLTTSFGIDWRTAEIDHYREVRDLLGNDFFHWSGNDFDSGTDYYKTLGDKIDYNNTNTVNWLGGYVQGEYTKNKITIYGTAGYSMIKYDFVDHFSMDESGGKVTAETDWIAGYQFKGGASFRASDQVHLFVNGGYVSKVPIFDQVIDDGNGEVVEDPNNEKFISFEAGINTSLAKNRVNISFNGYFTSWTDRAQTIGVINSVTFEDALVRLDGISSTHFGAELEGSWQPARCIRFNAAASFGVWEYTDDVSGTYIPDRSDPSTTETYNYYLKDLKVGDAPQTQIVVGLTIFPVPGMQAQILMRSYANYYSQYDPFDRTDEEDKEQVWKIPNYTLVDVNFAYRIPGQIVGMDVTVFAHVFNVLNELYVQDATDNSSYNAWTGDGKNHAADDAEIYPGLPTTFNVGFSAAL